MPACIHGMPDRTHCSICTRSTRKAVSTVKETQRSRSRSVPRLPKAKFLSHEFQEDGRVIRIEGDIAGGWRRHKDNGEPRKTFCFSEVDVAAWQGGAIRIQLNLFPRPSGVSGAYASAPKVALFMQRYTMRSLVRRLDGIIEKQSRVGFSFRQTDAESGRVVADVRLLPGANGVETDVDGCDFAALDLLHVVSGGYGWDLDIQLRLRFKQPAKPAPVEKSFWRDFLVGGRPESKRRKF